MHPESEEWQQEEEPQPLTVKRPNNWATFLKTFFQKHWHPSQLTLPSVDPSMPHLSAVERSAEVIRYSVHAAEYWLSPNGWLREFIKINFRLAIMLAIPSFMVVPLVTYALGQFSAWTALIATASTNMLFFPLTALLMVGLISALIYLGNSLRRRQHPQDMHRYY